MTTLSCEIQTRLVTRRRTSLQVITRMVETHTHELSFYHGMMTHRTRTTAVRRKRSSRSLPSNLTLCQVRKPKSEFARKSISVKGLQATLPHWTFRNL